MCFFSIIFRLLRSLSELITVLLHNPVCIIITVVLSTLYLRTSSLCWMVQNTTKVLQPNRLMKLSLTKFNLPLCWYFFFSSVIGIKFYNSIVDDGYFSFVIGIAN